MSNWLSSASYSFRSLGLTTDPNNVISPVLTVPSLPASTTIPTIYPPIIILPSSSSLSF
ncbi:hypothetical protein [Nostoc sp. UHCC 0302]|uniref:hypothetical protein n=1 Tax=Nostoc sp. UHCC 0302 TaxID=3134896 RepID=UPI00311CBC97